MKARILKSVPISKLLIASYCGLLIFVALIRFVEYKQTREAARKVNSTSKITNQKLELLINISQVYTLNQKKVFEALMNDENNNYQQYLNLIAFTSNNDNRNNYIDYEKFIRTDFERLIFNRILSYDSAAAVINDSLVRLHITNMLNQKQLLGLLRQQIHCYVSFDAACHQLQDFVSKEADMEISNTNNYLMHLARRKELGSYVVIILLLALGIGIGNTLRKLRRTENKYRLLFEFSPLPNFIVDSKTFRYLKVNDAAVRLYGYSREELLNMGAFDLRRITNKDQQENLKLKWKELIEAGKQYTIKARHYKKNGELLDVEVNAKTFFWDRKVFFLTINDITEKEKLDKKITKAIIKTQEDERRNLGAELHDNIGQVLASTQLFLGMAMKAEQNDKEKYLAETRKYLTLAINEIRDISHRVFPAFLEQISFPEAINNLLEGMNPDGKLRIKFEHDSRLLTEFINPDMKLNIYRILQEQLKNIQKYSKATDINIELRIKNNCIYLKISDNGIGFDLNKIKPGIGILNMRKRAELFSGIFLIDASPNMGCTLTVEIPLSTHKVA